MIQQKYEKELGGRPERIPLPEQYGDWARDLGKKWPADELPQNIHTSAHLILNRKLWRVGIDHQEQGIRKSMTSSAFASTLLCPPLQTRSRWLFGTMVVGTSLEISTAKTRCAGTLPGARLVSWFQ